MNREKQAHKLFIPIIYLDVISLYSDNMKT